jgi:hypothetical protein
MPTNMPTMIAATMAAPIVQSIASTYGTSTSDPLPALDRTTAT